MDIYQITDLGSRYVKNPRLPLSDEYKVLKELNQRSGATREQLETLTGLNASEATVALIKLQRTNLVEKIK